MINPNSPAHLTPCVSFLREYLRKIDRNGLAVFDDYMSAVHGEESGDVPQLMSDLTETLRTRFEVDVIDAREADAPLSSISNFEDRENAFAVLERAEHFNAAAYAGEFMSLAPYVLFNRHPEDAA
jgi:hypothetical protein